MDKAIIVSTSLLCSTYMIHLFHKYEVPKSSIEGFLYGFVGAATLYSYIMSVTMAIKLLSLIVEKNEL
jgi:hypothetical protein